MDNRIIECVPNFSEGKDQSIISRITAEISGVEGVKLLNTDPGKATNRTVVTFVGSPDAVVEAAFRAIRQASLLIDMRKHRGEHPRMGATDVCPLIPVSGITMEETVEYARALGRRVAAELNIPVYLYEAAALQAARKNLATIRTGEYEGLEARLKDPAWAPDFGEARFNPVCGATVIGARDFLVAYNVNLNTRSVKKANAVAFDVRENGRIKMEGGQPVLGKDGLPERIPGTLMHVKAIGWYIEEFGLAQVSMNLTNISATPIHIAFEEVRKKADERGMRVTGSELVGMVPLHCLLEAGKYFLRRQQRSSGVSETELVQIAVRSLGLSELGPFDPAKKIIEYAMADPQKRPLKEFTLQQFCDELASESYAPGGGSAAAMLGALGASLGTMVANLSAGKAGWEDRREGFSGWAEQGQQLKDELLNLVQEDTLAFHAIMDARALPRSSPEDKALRSKAIARATGQAIRVPLDVMRLSVKSFDMIRAMALSGNPNSASDAGVAALCARSAAHGAFLNVQINAEGWTDTQGADTSLKQAAGLLDLALVAEKEVLRVVSDRIRGEQTTSSAH